MLLILTALIILLVGCKVTTSLSLPTAKLTGSSIASKLSKIAGCSLAAGFMLCNGVGQAAAATTASSLPQYGIQKGRLLPCKTKSNCISTSSINSLDKYGKPWEFSLGSADEQFDAIVKAINSVTYLDLVESDKSKFYIRSEAKSAFPPTGVDDVEFLLNSQDRIITYRSNSRESIMAGGEVVGDGGANRNRLKTVQQRLGVAEMGMYSEEEDMLKKQFDKMSILDRFRAASEPSDINFVDNSVPDQQ